MLHRSRFAFSVLAVWLLALSLPGQDGFAIPASDEGLPGTGTIRRYEWFQKLWRKKRSDWAAEVNRDRESVVFFGDSITQSWGPNLGGAFRGLEARGVRVANRGISGDTTRGMLLRLRGDVLALDPRAVVLLMGTNDLEEGDAPEGIAANVQEIVRQIRAHDANVPVVLCKVFPSAASKRRPADAIQRINALCVEAVSAVPGVTVVDTWSLFADENGNAKKVEFPDLLHPNARGYAKWAAALRPVLEGVLFEQGAVGQPHPNAVVWQGEQGPGVGKHIVFLAGDHEYRGEETLPAMARILARRYGFRCTFLVTTNPKTGFIEPGSHHITGLEALATADLLVIFTRFQHFADDQMQHIEDYLAAGKPVLGLRTATHGFKGLEGKFAKYNEGYRGEDDRWRHGFGEEILGEHWVGHFGRNHKQSSNLVLEDEQRDHPILRGVVQPHAVSGGYVGHPKDGVTLARGHVLDGMTPDSPPSEAERQQARHSVAWVRNYRADNPKARVFATTHGASEDILDDDFRRMLLNAHFWCLGMETEIQPDMPIAFVGPYHPATFGFRAYRRGVRPADIAGWTAPIYDDSLPVREPKKK